MTIAAQVNPAISLQQALDRQAFELGIDHARFNLRRPRAESVPRELLRGYDNYRGRRKSSGNWAVNKWLALRLSALKRNFVITDDITPDFLDEIRPTQCPVTLALLTTGTGKNTDCSIDRLISNAAYARGNLVAMSAKANNAKGDLTFDEVLANALKPEPQNGLSQKEWARLLSLMFGAEVRINGNPHAYNIPLCTGIPNHIYCQPTQLLQEILLAEALESCILATPFWRVKTQQSLGNSRLYDAIYQALKTELKRCEHPYDAWFNMTPFEHYLQWLEAMEPYIALHLQKWNRTHRERNQRNEKYFDSWKVETIGKCRA